LYIVFEEGDRFALLAGWEGSTISPCVTIRVIIMLPLLDTLAAIARTIGESTFTPLSSECMNFALNLIRSRDDPDLRKVTFGVFASLSIVMKENMQPYLGEVVQPMTDAIVSVEGMTTFTKEEEEEAFPIVEGKQSGSSQSSKNIGLLAIVPRPPLHPIPHCISWLKGHDTEVVFETF